MQIAAISNVQNNKQNFGITPELYGKTKAVLTEKLPKETLDSIFKLFEKTNPKTNHLKEICFTADRYKLNAFITAEHIDRQDFSQRLFESTLHFIERVCNKAIKTDENVAEIIKKEHILDKFVK